MAKSRQAQRGARRPPRLGQHFLLDLGYRRRILDCLPLRPEELVIEIGPGRGAITELLAERARRIVAVEVDPTLTARLKDEFSERQVEVLQADILETNLSTICRRFETDQCFVFGNLPYYITTPILHHLLRFRANIRAMSLLMQREVAERVTARPHTRDYGYLSVLAQLYSLPRVALSVPPGAFSPPPKVHSALVDFQIKPEGAASIGESSLQSVEQEGFLEFVKHCFAQKRKNLRNNLVGTYSRPRVEEELIHLGMPSTLRAEELGLAEFIRLYRGLRLS